MADSDLPLKRNTQSMNLTKGDRHKDACNSNSMEFNECSKGEEENAIHDEANLVISNGDLAQESLNTDYGSPRSNDTFEFNLEVSDFFFTIIAITH